MTSFLDRATRFFVAPAEPAEFAPPRTGARSEPPGPRTGARGEPPRHRTGAGSEPPPPRTGARSEPPRAGSGARSAPVPPRTAFAPPRPRPAVEGPPLAEPEALAATGAAPRPRPAIGVVLAAEADLLVAAGALAASLRREGGASVALVCAWRGHGEPALHAPAPGSPAAGRLAAKLTRRGLPARASGAVCVAELPAGPDAAVGAFRDGAAAAGAPAILALARRDPAFDAILAGADRLVLTLGDEADAALAELALEGLRAFGPSAERIEPPRGLVARQLARLGLAPATARTPAALQERLS